MSFCFLGVFRFFSGHNYHVRRRDVPLRFFFFVRRFGLARRRHLTGCVFVIVICSVLAHSWIPSLSGSSSLLFVFSRLSAD